MIKKPWEGRFKEKNDVLFEKMNRSLDFDIRLFREDILLNKVYSNELCRLGIIKKAELNKIINGLTKLECEISNKGLSIFSSGIEDIHMGIEELLTKKIGNSAKKMHTGKSRNDQIATDVRLYLLNQIKEICKILKMLMKSFIDLSEKNLDAVMPGFTHFRQAQPVLFSHYLMSFFFSLERDYSRLNDSIKRISILPLGSAALSGTSFALNRKKIKEELGFEFLSNNSMDAVLSRDFIVEFLSNISILSLTLSRFAEDLIIFSSEQFGFFELSDKITTGSSIMPNKKNPDSLELTRGKTGRIIGNLVSLLTLLKGLPSTYNKDLQEDKEPLFDTIDTIEDILRVNIILLESLKINKKKMMDSIDPLSFATELADYLSKKNIPFRTAHGIVGKIVLYCIENNINLIKLKEKDLVKFNKNFKSIQNNWSDINSFLNNREITGGTGIKSVKAQIIYAKKIVNK